MLTMSIEDYVRAIRFTVNRSSPFLQVPIRLEAGTTWRYAGRRLYDLDQQAVVLPQEDAAMRKRLERLLEIPAMSSFTVAALINTIVAGLKDDAAYLNIGVWHGYSLLAGMLGNPDRRVIGVDNFTGFGGPREAFNQRFHRAASARHSFFDMDSQDYFAEHHQGTVGFYFYDGDHSYEAQLGGLKACEPFLTDDALILVDDTNREAPRQATLEFLTQRKGRYKLIWDVSTGFESHPTVWNGLMLLRRVG